MFHRRSGFQLVLVFALAVLTAGIGWRPASAQQPSGPPATAGQSGNQPGPPSPTIGPAGPPLGIVPPNPGPGKAPGPGGGPGPNNNLSYHSGPVMLTNNVYAIYWFPSGSTVGAGYQSTIDGFFDNVAAAKGVTTNVYYSDTQYYQGSGQLIQDNSTHVASIVDTTAFPSNGCTDSYTSICLSDAQLRQEIANDIQTNGWTAGPGNIFFIFTPKGVGSCYGSSCAFTYYCAYHNSFPASVSGGTVYYANMPYADTVPSACDYGQHPNGNDADATLNVTSHEHNESITDPAGSAWYDRRGYEDGDKCNWNFGTALSGSNGSEYNQVINGGHYWLQQEWSNKSGACVLQGL